MRSALIGFIVWNDPPLLPPLDFPAGFISGDDGSSDCKARPAQAHARDFVGTVEYFNCTAMLVFLWQWGRITIPVLSHPLGPS